MNDPEPLVRTEGLMKHFPVRHAWIPGLRWGSVRAVDGVDLAISRGRTMGLIGESGCGKSTLARLLLRLIEPTAGRIVFKGMDLSLLPQRALRAMRRQMQIIFQDPYASLDPYHTAGWSIEEPLRIFGEGDAPLRRARVLGLLDKVGLKPDAYARYPHEFSGGQRQRVSIARALALSPSLVVCDEPVSSLDVSVQAQVINLLKDLQEAMQLTYLFVSHDLSIVRHMADEIAVMYGGRIVEQGTRRQIFTEAAHPYTKTLLDATPSISSSDRHEGSDDRGDPAETGPNMRGCQFRARCPVARARCREIEPALLRVTGEHKVACHLVNDTV